jgi:hypothetical protein
MPRLTELEIIIFQILQRCRAYGAINIPRLTALPCLQRRRRGIFVESRINKPPTPEGWHIRENWRVSTKLPRLRRWAAICRIAIKKPTSNLQPRVFPVAARNGLVAAAPLETYRYSCDQSRDEIRAALKWLRIALQNSRESQRFLESSFSSFCSKSPSMEHRASIWHGTRVVM